jgi:hypothetical protein
MKKLIWIIAGTLVLPQTLLFADELGRIDARVNAMSEAKAAARNIAKNEARIASLKPIVTPKPTVNTSVLGPQIIKKVEFKADVVALKNTAKQSQKDVVAVKLELKNATTPTQKADLQNKLKVELQKLKTDNTAFKKKLVEEARNEVHKASKARTTH